MNSTHAAWVNGGLAAAVSALTALGATTGLPGWVSTDAGIAVLILNAVAHASLPDAPKGGGK